ncbi:MAG: hypothetical protein CMF31_05255 [Kordiimonas sp.]|nr:hypothetical protein [Kordiimonas sp.]|tara:strand:- start:927 stop:1430 length:504 start_codon:yes stop_codon:yes gene_type:complete
MAVIRQKKETPHRPKVLSAHDALAHDLAAYLAQRQDYRIVFENISMGGPGNVRPDVYVLHKSYTCPCPITYEIKISRSDFLSDIRTQKWREYRPYSECIYFATVEGLISTDEVPDECGLLLKKKSGWRTAKKAAHSTLDSLPITVASKLVQAAASNRHTALGHREEE